MSTRPKKKQNGKGDKRVTIDAKHNEQVKTFKSMKKEIPDLESKIKNLSKEIDKIEDGLKNVKQTSNDFIKLSNQKMRYEDEIQELKQRIAFINDDKKEYDYYLSAGPYVMQYFVNKDNISKGEIIASKNPSKHKKKPYDKSILDFIMEQTKEDNITTEKKSIEKPEIKGISFAEFSKSTKHKKNKGDNNSFEHKLNSIPLDKINYK
jgi:cell division protein FtsB